MANTSTSIMQKVILIVLVSVVFGGCSERGRSEFIEVKFKQYHLSTSRLDTIHLKDSATYVLEKREFDEKVVYNLKWLNESLTAFDDVIKGDSLFFGNHY